MSSNNYAYTTVAELKRAAEELKFALRNNPPGPVLKEGTTTEYIVTPQFDAISTSWRSEGHNDPILVVNARRQDGSEVVIVTAIR